jgi:3-isopropylmalate dehydratase small subunit
VTAYILEGRAWRFPGLLDVDWEICPFNLVREWQRVGTGSYRYEELGRYCMTAVDPQFPDKVRPGDFIIAEENMGFGHDHDHACASIKGAGVGAVLCASAAPYFLRNSFDHGLPVLEIPGVFTRVAQYDKLVVDLAGGRVHNLSQATTFTFEPVPKFLREILAAGGRYPYLRAQQARASAGADA